MKSKKFPLMGGKDDVLMLSAKDLKIILNMKECIQITEDAFMKYENGEFEKCSKYIFDVPAIGDIRFMGAINETCINTKILTGIDNNPRKGVTLGGFNILYSKHNLRCLCISDAEYLTHIRTGAAGAVAAKYLSPKFNNITVGVVGAGNQAIFQLRGLYAYYGDSMKFVKVYDINPQKPLKLKEKMGIEMRCPIEIVNSAKNAVLDSDILITATPSHKPIVKHSWIEKGVHINAIGADTEGKQELDPTILPYAKVIVDDIQQAIKYGEINVPISEGIISKDDIYATLGEIILSKKDGRSSRDEITIFDSTGLSVQDLVISELAYKKVISMKGKIKNEENHTKKTRR